MWQASFLKLNRVHSAFDLVAALFVDQFSQVLLFLVKHSAHNVRSVMHTLARQQLFLCLWPAWNGGHSNQDVRVAILATHCQSILTLLMIEPWRSGDR